jgi:hypothetical protein
MAQEKQLVVSNLTSKIRTLTHLTRDHHACIEAWPFAHIVLLVSCTELNVFRHGYELRKHLDCMAGFIGFDLLEAMLYDICDISGFIVLFQNE